jgi:hypothetical protein
VDIDPETLQMLWILADAGLHPYGIAEELGLPIWVVEEVLYGPGLAR